jgi:5-methylcytosine-specific restriction protein A
MKFGANQKLRFGAVEGSYSIVTDREFFDKQITATDAESALLNLVFGSSIFKGNVKDGGAEAKKEFKLYPSGESILLSLVYPKPLKTELRLYLSSRAGFKPNAGEIWFLFLKDDAIWIGSQSEGVWRGNSKILVYDESEGDYQDSIQELDEIKTSRIVQRDVYRRDRRKALERLKLAEYQCENNCSRDLFISRSTQTPYLEAHHLIPMALQKNTKTPLDTLCNIYCLCPHCHREIHHGQQNTVKTTINNLVYTRPKVLEILDNQIDDIYGFYAVEDII